MEPQSTFSKLQVRRTSNGLPLWGRIRGCLPSTTRLPQRKGMSRWSSTFTCSPPWPRGCRDAPRPAPLLPCLRHHRPAELRKRQTSPGDMSSPLPFPTPAAHHGTLPADPEGGLPLAPFPPHGLSHHRWPETAGHALLQGSSRKGYAWPALWPAPCPPPFLSLCNPWSAISKIPVARHDYVPLLFLIFSP